MEELIKMLLFVIQEMDKPKLVDGNWWVEELSWKKISQDIKFCRVDNKEENEW